MDHSSQPENKITQEIQDIQKAPSGKRLISWMLFIGILVLFLALPLFGYFYSSPSTTIDQPTAGAGSKIHQSTLYALDRVWNPGLSISGAHQSFANDCQSCHTELFARVKDSDCKTCHQTIGGHIPAGITTEKMADTGASCASCHQEHKGTFGLVAQNKYYSSTECVACHKDIKKSAPTTLTSNVSSFTNQHPEFRLQTANIADNPVSFLRTRMEIGRPITEKTGLKFPHDVHLKAEGVQSPKGLVKTSCNSCHEKIPNTEVYEKVNFEKNCQSCHELKFEPTVFNRQVPHGSVDVVLSTLREFYSYAKNHRMPTVSDQFTPSIVIQRPGEKETPARTFLTSGGDEKAAASGAAVQLFENTSCIVCHEIKRISGPGKVGTSGADLPQWEIAKVAPEHAWMPKAKFPHSAHSMSNCATCHQAEKSKKSSEVLMPAIGVCQDCHSEKAPMQKRVSAECGTCHGFHNPHESTETADKKDLKGKSTSTKSWFNWQISGINKFNQVLGKN